MARPKWSRPLHDRSCCEYRRLNANARWPCGGDAASQGQGGQGGWGQPQQPQAAQQFSGGGAPAARSSAPAPQTNEPPMDFDDDIPF